LTEARALLDDYEKTIENLNSELAETQENLESATKDIDWHKHEMQRFQTNNSFQGETYESAGHQIKAMESERIELLKQLEAARGQAGLANGSVEKIQAMLNHEKQTNAALRKRQELNSLQDQIQAAHKTVETEKLKNTELRSESRALREEMAEMRREVESARDAVKAEARHADAEKQKQEALKDELRTQEAKYREAVLATVKAEEDRDAARRQSSPQTPHRNSDGHERPSLPPRGQSDTVADRSSTSPGGTTPGTPLSPSGFRTIHGTHRPDGSLGGWRNGRVGRGLPPPAARDSLYDSSIAEEPVRRRPLNAQNSYSDTASAAGSNEATEGRGGARPGMNGGD
jgi:septal ring factor EnvC (AmiA/AmiB activator)